MNNNNAAFAYQQEVAQSGTPIGRVVALYDTILRDFRRAQEAVQSGNIEKRTFELNHALTVIAHLQNVLDHERGEAAARQFEHFYEVTRGLILEANINATHDSLQKLIDLYTPVRQAWQTIEKQVPPVESQAAALTQAVKSATLRQVPDPTQDSAEATRGKWSA